MEDDLLMMEYRQLGHTQVTVSAFSLGSWLTYEFMDEDEALAVIESGLNAGINFLDDARYNDRTGKAPLKSGYSEVLFGQLLRRGGWPRENLVIANKLWYEFYPEESPEAELDGSLSRLQMAYMDLVYCVPPPPSLPVAELVRQMDDLIKTGKLRHWGILNWSPAQIQAAYEAAAAHDLVPPCAAQLAYSLLQTSPAEDQATRTLFAEAGISIVASYSLHGGLLTGKYSQTTAGEEGRFNEDALAAMRQKKQLQKAAQLVTLARQIGCTPAQLALAYCLANDQVASVLFGATKVSQVEENLKALAVASQLTAETMNQLRQLG